MTEHSKHGDEGRLLRIAALLREVSMTEGLAAKPNHKVKFLNDLAKELKAVDRRVSRRLCPEGVVYCLRQSLVSPNGAVRAATLRAFRYLMVSQELHQVLLDSRLDIFITRSLDQESGRETERLQAIKLIRTMLLMRPDEIPMTFGRVLVAVAESHNDNMSQSVLAVLCEMTVLNPKCAALCGAIRAITSGIVANQGNVLAQRLQKTYGTAIPMNAPLNEFMTLSLLRLLNTPDTRCYLRPGVDLEIVMAPLLDVHYKHSSESAEGNSQQAKEEKLVHINAAQMALLTMFRTWTGIMYLCQDSSKSPLRALIEVLPYPDEPVQMGIMNVIYSVFHLKVPDETDDFNQALESTDPSRFQEEWHLDQGWVAEEGRALLPRRSSSRLNMMDQYHALLLRAFLDNGILEKLADVVLSHIDVVRVRATILLGELLHMANTLLPLEMACESHCLPKLVTLATAFEEAGDVRNRAIAVINCLDRVHQMKKALPRPNSLYLSLLLQGASFTYADSKSSRSTRTQDVLSQDTDDAQLAVMIRDTQVQQVKDYGQWNWNLIGSLLRLNTVTLKRVEDQHPKFMKRLINFYRPSSSGFSQLALSEDNVKKYSAIGQRFISWMLAGGQDEPPKPLVELVQDILNALGELLGRKDTKPELRGIFTSSGVSHTLSRDYFLFLGQLSASKIGVQLLEKLNAFRDFLDLCELTERTDLLRLLAASLDYTRDGHCRIVLSKLLTNSCKDVRVYTTCHLRVLLRAKVPFFQNWCMELLVTQLYDSHPEVSYEALDILDEACEDESCLHALVMLQPSLLHLGPRGKSLFTRFLAINRGLWYLKSLQFVSTEMERWFQHDNKSYVTLVESRLATCFTSFKLQPEGQYTRRSHHDRPLAQSRELLVPVHFYGQLVQQKEGFDILVQSGHVGEFAKTLEVNPKTPEELLNVKAAVWALGHIGTAFWGLKAVQEEGVIPMLVQIAETSDVFTLRGTCVFALGLIAQLPLGCDILAVVDWDGVRHSGATLWPVAEPVEISKREDANDDRPSGESSDEQGNVCAEVSRTPKVLNRSISNQESRSTMSLSSSVDDNVDLSSPVDDADRRLSKMSSSLVSLSFGDVDYGRALGHRRKGSGSDIHRNRKSSFRIARTTPGDYIGVCLPKNTDKMFKYNQTDFSASWPRTFVCAQIENGLSRDSFHDQKRCVQCIHKPVEGISEEDIDKAESQGKGAGMSSGREGYRDGKSTNGSAESTSSDDKSSTEPEFDDSSLQGRHKIRKEVILLVSKVSGAVGSRANQQGIQMLKEKFPNMFKDTCLYSQVADLLSFYHFRAHVRRFVQHLFDDANFQMIFGGFQERPSIHDLILPKVDS